MDFCPVHRTPIMITDCNYARRRLAYFPASELGRSGKIGQPSQTAMESGATNREAFIQLASDIAWLLKNGLRLNRDTSITQVLSQGKRYYDNRYLAQALFLGQKAEKALDETSPVFRKVIAGDLKPGNYIYICIREVCPMRLYSHT